MLKKTITYTDFDGNERVKDCYFNLSKGELIEMEMSSTGGFANMINAIIAFIVFSYITKWWSTNCSRAPF